MFSRFQVSETPLKSNDMIFLQRGSGSARGATAAAPMPRPTPGAGAGVGGSSGGGVAQYAGLTLEDIPADVQPNQLHAILQQNPHLMTQVWGAGRPRQCGCCDQRRPSCRLVSHRPIVVQRRDGLLAAVLLFSCAPLILNCMKPLATLTQR
jgi:hypothetical protein